MKVNRLFALMAGCAILAASCGKTEDPAKPSPNPEPEKKSEECRLLKLSAVTVDGEIEANLYSNEKVAEITYLGEQLEGLKSATLKVEVSPKAITDLENGKVYDLSVETPSFTITSEDGEHTATWTVMIEAAKIALSCDIADENVPGKFGINEVSPLGASVAFCGTDKIVTLNGEVYDFDANKVGNLNMEGILPDALILNLNNDVNGVVVASFGFTLDKIATRKGDDIKNCYVYCWKDGYDKAPTLIYTNANGEDSSKGNSIGYMSCGGDVNGDFILNAITGGRSAAIQTHHVWEFHNGDFSKSTWYGFSAAYPANDGNWGQMISPASGNVNGTFFIGDSVGNNLGYHVYTRQGVKDTGEDVALNGTTKTTVPEVQQNGIPEGNAQYGNYSTGNIKAFMFNGTPYVAAATTGWHHVYITIQSNDPSDEDNHYLLETQYFDAPEIVPSVAYVYDPATDTGQVLLLGGNLVIARYEIKREFI